MNERAKTILDFWFIQTSQKEKFGNNKTFDKKIRDNFLNDYKKAIIVFGIIIILLLISYVYVIILY